MRASVVAAGIGPVLILGALPAAVAQQAPRPVVASDRSGDAAQNGLDLTRVQLGRTTDGDYRAVLSLADDFTPRTLLARSGPPGSICLRLWTTRTPTRAAPDHLVCVTGRASGAAFDAVVQRDVAGGAPRRGATAVLTRSSDRSVIVRFSARAIGNPTRRLRFAGEATRPGCIRPSCVDLAPNGPTVKTLRTS